MLTGGEIKCQSRGIFQRCRKRLSERDGLMPPLRNPCKLRGAVSERIVGKADFRVQHCCKVNPACRRLNWSRRTSLVRPEKPRRKRLSRHSSQLVPKDLIGETARSPHRGQRHAAQSQLVPKDLIGETPEHSVHTVQGSWSLNWSRRTSLVRHDTQGDFSCPKCSVSIGPEGPHW